MVVYCFISFSFNFYTFSLDCICNFSTKLSSTLILQMENDNNLFVEDKNEEAFCSVTFWNVIISFHKVTLHFSLRVNILMICPFSSFFDTYHLMWIFTLITTWAIVNAYWHKNSIDVALNFFYDSSKFDNLVLFTLQISFVICWIIILIRFCSDVTNLHDP